jgi:hypothetical protein
MVNLVRAGKWGGGGGRWEWWRGPGSGGRGAGRGPHDRVRPGGRALEGGDGLLAVSQVLQRFPRHDIARRRDVAAGPSPGHRDRRGTLPMIPWSHDRHLKFEALFFLDCRPHGICTGEGRAHGRGPQPASGP